MNNFSRRFIFRPRVWFVALAAEAVLCILGAWWIGMIFIALFVIYRVFALTNPNGTLSFAALLLFALLSTIVCRLFILELYVVPSESMEDDLFAGDHILVSKVSYGPRLPIKISDIPWVNALPIRGNTVPNWPYVRLSGISSMARGDVVVFKKPHARDKIMVKRCVGLPNDTISFSDGTFFVNAVPTVDSETVKYSYTANFKNEDECLKFGRERNISVPKQSKSLRVFLTKSEYFMLKNASSTSSLRLNDNRWPFFCDELVSQQNFQNPWRVESFGPLMVPKKGLTVLLGPMSQFFYLGSIRNEGIDVKIVDGRLDSCGKKISKYKFLQDHYFVLGDNRSSSRDSRFWGFVPEHNIEGRVVGSF